MIKPAGLMAGIKERPLEMIRTGQDPLKGFWVRTVDYSSDSQQGYLIRLNPADSRYHLVKDGPENKGPGLIVALSPKDGAPF